MKTAYFSIIDTILIIIPTAFCITIALLYRKCITECARLKAQLSEAIENSRRNTDFFTNMVHELKTPLSVILGAIQLIELRKTGGPADDINITKNLKTIRTNCLRLLRLINNLLDLSRADAGYLKLKPVNCDLNQVLSEIVQSVQPYVLQKQLSLQYNKPADSINTAIDLEKMERIMLNLLSNAIKFTPSSGSISVTPYKSGEKVYISVKDSGLGIPPERQKEVFYRFRQLENGSSQEGSGIGLSLVKSYVNLHQGDIRIVSEPGKGSEFIIDLPVTKVDDTLNDYNDKELNVRVTEATKVEFSGMHSAVL